MNPLSSNKILSFYHEAKQILNGDIPFPRMVSCWLTTLCNYNCPYCLFKEENKTERVVVNADAFMKFIDNIAALGVKSLEFSGGGEPTLHPKFLDITQHGHKAGLKLGLITNGTNLLYETLKDFRYVRIGLDASNSETYNLIKKPPINTAFDIVLKKISKLIEARGNNNRPRIGIKFIINTLNYEDIPNMVYLGERLNVDYIQFKGEHNGPNVLNDKQRDLCEEILDDMRLVAHGNKPDILGSVRPQRISVKCFLSPIHAVINPKGDVLVCCYFTNKIIGNAFKEPFEKFWGSKEHKKILQGLTINACKKWDCRFFGYNKKMKEVIDGDVIDINFI